MAQDYGRSYVGYGTFQDIRWILQNEKIGIREICNMGPLGTSDWTGQGQIDFGLTKLGVYYYICMYLIVDCDECMQVSILRLA